METAFSTPDQYLEKLIRISENLNLDNGIRPERFMKIMYEHRGFIDEFSPFENDSELWMKNPLVVAFGDSVTAGHFEFNGDMETFFYKAENKLIQENEVIEIIDVRKSYCDIFRSLLIDKYEQTSVSLINAGIAGDTAHGMLKRIDRDVISHQPDLVLVNGSLNWELPDGDDDEFYMTYSQIVKILKEKTSADIILLTPNIAMQKPTPNDKSTLKNRAAFIRQIAKEEKVSLVDIYKLFEVYSKEGNPIEPLLANGLNHPSAEIHELIAKLIMRLFEG